jgi:DNA (cytosine-5)-methyltransferase 1
MRVGFEDMPHLSVRMAARIQGFPDVWEFSGAKTHAYRQVGNAFPPPVAQAVGAQIARAINAYEQAQVGTTQARGESLAVLPESESVA